MEAQSAAAPTGAEHRRLNPRWEAGFWAAVVGIAVVAAVGAGGWWIASLGPPPLGNDLGFLDHVVDRDGRLLRAYATGEAAGACRRAPTTSIRAISTAVRL